MGIFDTVILTDEVKKSLGRYGSGDYQTKYQVVEGYILVYNVYEFKHVCWEISVFIDLLVRPRSNEIYARDPCMYTIRLDELGTIEYVDVKTHTILPLVDTSALRKILEEKGFRYKGEDTSREYISVQEKIGSISIGRNKKVIIKYMMPTKKKDILSLIPKLVIKTEKGALVVDLDSTIKIYGGEVYAYTTTSSTRVYKKEAWIKDEYIISKDTVSHVRIEYKLDFTPHELFIETSTRLKYSSDLEEKINRIVNYIESFTKELLTK